MGEEPSFQSSGTTVPRCRVNSNDFHFSFPPSFQYNSIMREIAVSGQRTEEGIPIQPGNIWEIVENKDFRKQPHTTVYELLSSP